MRTMPSLASEKSILADRLRAALVREEELDVGRHQQRAVLVQDLLHQVVADMTYPA